MNEFFPTPDQVRARLEAASKQREEWMAENYRIISEFVATMTAAGASGPWKVTQPSGYPTHYITPAEPREKALKGGWHLGYGGDRWKFRDFDPKLLHEQLMHYVNDPLRPFRA